MDVAPLSKMILSNNAPQIREGGAALKVINGILNYGRIEHFRHWAGWKFKMKSIQVIRQATVRFVKTVMGITTVLAFGLFNPALSMPGATIDPRQDAGKTFSVTTVDGKATINLDITAAPELTNWTRNQLAPVLAEWYPKIVAMLPSEGFAAPTHFTVTIRDMGGVAYTSGTEIVVSKDWIKSQMNGQAVGSLVHEMVHVVQQYHDVAAPGWLVEGMADYVRWFKFEPQSHGADLVWIRQQEKGFSPHFNDSYRITANFLNWVAEKYDKGIVCELNAALREGKYNDALWTQYTGKTAPQLGEEWSKDIEAQLAKMNQ
jgi:hypothetical protein